MFVLAAEANILERCNYQHSKKAKMIFPAVMPCEYNYKFDGVRKEERKHQKKYLKMH